MARETKNTCEIEEYVVDEVEMKEGKSSQWCRVKGHYTVTDRDGNELNVPIRCSAFGVVASRIAQVQGRAVRCRFEMGGWMNDKGYVNPDYVCVSVSRPWDDAAPARAASHAKAAPAPADDDSDLPFGIVGPILMFLTLGAAAAGSMA